MARKQADQTVPGGAKRTSDQPVPDDANLRYAAGLRALEQGNARLAAGHFRQAVHLRPSFAEAHNNLGLSLNELGQTEKALACFRRALELEPEYVLALNNLAYLSVERGRHEEAIAYFDRVLEIEPDHAVAHNDRGRSLKSLGRLEEAATGFRRALAVKPDFALAAMNLGQMHLMLGRLDDSEAWYRRAVALDPTDPRAVFSVGSVMMENGKIDQAIALYRKALALDPTYDAAINNLGMALDFRPDFNRQIAACRKSLATRPNSVSDRVELAGLLWQRGAGDEALPLLEGVLAVDEKNADANYWLGLVHRTNGEPALARHFLARAAALDPRNVYVEAALASLDAAEPDSRGESTKRVALHLHLPFHYQILAPVFEALKSRHICLITPHLTEVYAFKPDVVVLAESNAPFMREQLPTAVFVATRHGLISKNTTAHAARVSDYFCLTSEASRDWYIRNGGRPRRDFWITGYSQMDALFGPGALPLEFDIAAGQKVVLYAPTWTPELSSADMLGAQAVDLIRGRRDDITLLIKPHPVTADHRPEWLETWRALAVSNDRVHLFDDPAADVMPLLKNADVLVTDTSSVMFQYLAVDRPMVLITNPARREASHFDAEGVEWRWRDVGSEVFDVRELAGAVSEALDNPALGAERRAHYRHQMFGRYTDGRASERIARKITELEL